MPNIREYETPNLRINPSEVGVEATAMAARRVGLGFNQEAGALRGLAGETEGLGRETQGLGRDVQGLGRQQQQFGREVESLGAYKERALDDVGRRVGSAVADAGDVAVRYQEHQEITHGGATFAQLTAGLTDQWNSAVKSADPNDASVSGRFTEEVLNPAIDKFPESFSTEAGQRWAQSHAEALRAHFAEKQTADMAGLAADAVHVNVNKMSNAWTNTARSDPSSVPFLLSTADSSIAGVVASSPNLRGIDAAKLHTEVAEKAKETIVRAGALGAIEKSADPEHAWQGWASRYPDYINAQEMDQFAKSAKTFQRMNQEGARAAQAEQRRQATAAFHKDANQWELNTIDENGNAVLPPNAVGQLKDLVTKSGDAADPSRVTAMVRRVQELGKVLDPASAANLKKTSDATERSLYTDMTLPQPGAEPVTPDAINKAYSDGKLQFAARNRLLKNYQDDRSPDGEALAKDRSDFFRNFASTIDPGRDQATGAGASALGSQKIGEAQAEARRMEGVLRQQGKDPHSLYDPKSPDYFGNSVSRFRPTLAEKAAFDAQVKADQAKTAAPAAGPKVGDRQQFKQGWGVWNGTAWVPAQ